MGLMLTPNMGNLPDLRRLWWAADTGLFSPAGERSFSLTEYLAWLDQRRPMAQRCLFATAPDKVGDHAETWQRSRDVLPLLRRAGYRPAFVAQDGCTARDVDAAAAAGAECLFIGGTTDWKKSEGFALIAAAKDRGLWTHVGRVNSWARVRASVGAGADSCDGTYVLFGPDKNLPRWEAWSVRANLQPALGMTA